MSTFTLNLEKTSASNEAVTIFQARGKLSLETVNEFIKTLRPEPAKYLVLDMSEVSFLDSAGVGTLVSLFVSRRNQGKMFALVGLAQQARAVVTVAGLQNLLPVYKSVEEAIAAKI